MSAPPAIAYSVDDDGIGWIVLDDPGAQVNVFNPSTQAALAAAIETAERGTPRAVVIASDKERVFIAGADLKLLAVLPDAATAAEFSRQGQRLFQRLAELPVPVVCAIHGACAGGGFELALACHWRIASDASVTQIGLPETSIGTIPGWGGSVRLPRLIGAERALDHILRAQLLTPADALASGLIHEVVPAGEIRARAKAAAVRLAAEGCPAQDMPPRAAPPEFFRELRESVQAKTRGHQPALLAAIDAVEQGARLSLPDAFEIEATLFGAVTAGDVCKNLIHVFFLRDAAKKRTLDGWFEDVGAALRRDLSTSGLSGRGVKPLLQPIRRVGVVGAGVMGSGIAHWLAARGFDVVLREVSPELVERGREVIRGLFDEAVRRGKISAGEANAALHRIATTTGWDGFEACDLVIEAIVEDAAAKRVLFTEVARVAPAGAILASNTSALPLEEIAAHVPHPARCVGIHFFNPVSRMPLVELIIGAATSAETAERALGLVKALGKSPIVCRSSPGFLVTRVLFFYLNEAVRRWEQGVSTVVIDGALRDFGWPMGPLRLIDEVGVDVTDFIFGEMERYFPQRFTRSKTTARMLAAGLKGRKGGAGRGFYRYEGKDEIVNEGETRPLANAPNDDASRETSCVGGEEPERLTAELMRVMAGEAERCLAEGIVRSADDVDFAFLSGAGFPAFRGGLLRWARRSTP